MHLYLNYAREHWMVEGENPPVGLILCAERALHAREPPDQGAGRGVPHRVAKEPVLVAEIEKTSHAQETRPRCESEGGRHEGPPS